MKTKASGWLYTWAWGIQKASKNAGQRLEVHLLGLQQGLREARRQEARLVHASRPASGPRPTQNPDYLKAAAAFAEPTKTAIDDGRPDEPGRPAAADDRHPVRRHPRVPRPRHQGSQDISSAIAGKTSVDDALDQGPEARRRQVAETLPGQRAPRAPVDVRPTGRADTAGTPARRGTTGATAMSAPSASATASGRSDARPAAAGAEPRLGAPGAAAARR